HLCQQSIPDWWRLDELRSGYRREFSIVRDSRRQNSERGKASELASGTANQIRIRDQYEDGEGARIDCVSRANVACRRSDRIAGICPLMALADIGCCTVDVGF